MKHSSPGSLLWLGVSLNKHHQSDRLEQAGVRRPGEGRVGPGLRSAYKSVWPQPFQHPQQHHKTIYSHVLIHIHMYVIGIRQTTSHYFLKATNHWIQSIATNNWRKTLLEARRRSTANMNLGSLDPALGCSGLMSILSYDSHPVSRSQRHQLHDELPRLSADQRDNRLVQALVRSCYIVTMLATASKYIPLP